LSEKCPVGDGCYRLFADKPIRSHFNRGLVIRGDINSKFAASNKNYMNGKVTGQFADKPTRSWCDKSRTGRLA